MVAVVSHSPLASYFEIIFKSNVRTGCIFQPLAYEVVNTAIWVSVIIKYSITFLFLTSTLMVIFPNSDNTAQFHRLLIWFTHTLGVFIASSSIPLYLIWLVATSIVTLRFQYVLSNIHNQCKFPNTNESKIFSYTSYQPKTFDIPGLNTFWFNSLISNLRSFGLMFCFQTSVDMENVVLTLGTLSSVCCVNQEGVISHSLPTPEKMFFFHRRHHHHHHQENYNTNKSQSIVSKQNSKTKECYDYRKFKSGQLTTPVLQPTMKESGQASQGKLHKTQSSIQGGVPSSINNPNETSANGRSVVFTFESCTTPVVLDLRTDFYCPFVSRFERPRWDRFLSSLKPIGLSLLLNNCHSPIAEQLLGFSDKMNATQKFLFPSSCITTLPLTFCLCGLAGQIGFRDGALNGFVIHGCLGAYAICSAAYSNANTSDIKSKLSSAEILPTNESAYDNRIHLAHCFSAVFSDPNMEGGYQLLSQGTGDILASLCSDVWDGRDIIPLSDRERDLILGFHNRHLSSSYCIGFAYSPLVDKIWESCKLLLTNISNSSDFFMLRLPGSDIISPETQRKALQHVVRSRLTSRWPPPLHVVDNIDNDSIINNGLSHNSDISIRSRGMSKSSGLSGCCQLKFINNVRKLNFHPFSIYRQHQGCIVKKEISTNSNKLCKRLLTTRNDNFIKMHETKPTSINIQKSSNSGDYATTCLPLNEFPSLTCVSETDDHCKRDDSSLNHDRKNEVHVDRKEVDNILSNQIFLGLVSMQYQANPQVVKSIKQFHQACIRFVHFSRENELRSRVFAERLGLECGWNCHISLKSSDRVNISKSINQSKEFSKSYKFSAGTDLFVSKRKCFPGSTQTGRSSSSPAITTPYPSTLEKKFGSISDPHYFRSNFRGKYTYFPEYCGSNCNEEMPLFPTFRQTDSSFQSFNLYAYSHDYINERSIHAVSTSCLQPMHSNENDTRESSGTYHMSISSTSDSSTSLSVNEQSDNSEEIKISQLLTENKSRLPCGIDNIRPHLENIDNVPLQVSLFTDCTPKAINQMVQIMKEYGDTVCLIGSCYSLTNYALFQQGDVAIAVKPILPYSTCQFAHSELKVSNQNDPKSGEPGCSKNNSTFTSQKNDSTNVSMFDIAAHLIHLVTPCLLDIEKTGFHVYDLIVEAHASVNNLYHCLVFSSATPLAVGLLQLLLLIVGLPTRPIVLSAMKSNLQQSELIWLPKEPFISIMFGPREILINLSKSDNYTSINLLQYGSNRNLEPSFGTGQMIWLLFIVLPALTLSLIDRQVERNQVLREPPIKRNKLFTKRRCLRFALVTCSRFIPSVLICALCEIGHLLWAQQFEECPQSFRTIYENRFNETYMVINNPNVYAKTLLSSPYAIQELCLSKLSTLIYSLKDLVFYQFSMCLIIISFSYANYGQRVWEFRYSTNPSWCIASSLVCILHSLYVIIRFCSIDSSLTSWYILSPIVSAFSFIWCILLVFINDFISWRENRAILTEHRLSRLYFNTKLGMYSPV
ncbi:Transmembrane protein 94 [Schistosoma japonicum]|nr:Transmembrane protein 94 [Schistosoma japonicum]KAH8864948.1 Transmembrane protein 94 [Schistosoma japonicum]